MSENPEGRPPGTTVQPDAADAPEARQPEGTDAPAVATEQPVEQPAETPVDPTGDTAGDTAGEVPAEPPVEARSIHVPDALGEVEEQERLPEAQSTIAEPGEALEELLPALEVTGHAGVDDALATLDDMAEKSVHEHVEVFDAVHEELRRTLDQAADQ